MFVFAYVGLCMPAFGCVCLRKRVYVRVWLRKFVCVCTCAHIVSMIVRLCVYLCAREYVFA